MGALLAILGVAAVGGGAYLVTRPATPGAAAAVPGVAPTGVGYQGQQNQTNIWDVVGKVVEAGGAAAQNYGTSGYNTGTGEGSYYGGASDFYGWDY